MVSAASPLEEGYVLDTCVFIAAERGEFELDEFVRNTPPTSYVMSSVTAAELLLGIELATPAKRELRQGNVSGYLAGFPILDFDIHCARHWAKIAAQLRAKGLNIGTNDLLIAATAVRYNYGVITFNAREFSRIQGLAVITP